MKEEKFIEKARKVHGDKYDYSKVKYVNSTTKVCIICPTHGEFWQIPSAHLRGNGCPMCANLRRGKFGKMSQAEFIEKARKVHGDKYDYSKVEFVNSTTKVCIICPIHGEFWMLPLNHIYVQKQGCPKCASRGLTTEEIVKRFKEVHGNEYDYSKVEYNKMHSKVCIVCPKHGEFWQTPSKHLKGQGCGKCGIEKRAKKKTKTTSQFIEEVRAIHGNKYDYSKVKYVSAFEKVCIVCPTHGEFLQRAFDHLHGHGCPKCCQSSLEREIGNLLTENGILYEEQKKFPWLRKQSIDFYLPEYNVGIECQGEQHFKAVEHFGGERELEIVKERDSRKSRLCSQNGVKILYYSRVKMEGCINDKAILLTKIKQKTC